MNNKQPAAAMLPHFEGFPLKVKNALQEFFDSRREDTKTIGYPVADAAAHLEAFVLNGGKRIRPLYSWAGFIGAGGLDTDVDPHEVITAASALELIQACALVHDDIVDASDTRRGNPTMHRQLEQYHKAKFWDGDSAHYGTVAAILVGDLALVWAEDMFQQAKLPAHAHARAQEPWRAMRTEVIGGQILDITLEASASESIELAQSVTRFKTAAYTIERPLHIGAAIAGADEELISAFRGYGHDIGIAYQLRDDELGVFGDSAVTGKPTGDDLREGKRTVLLSLALERCTREDPAAATTLRELVGRTDDPEDIARMSEIIDNSGARADLEDRIQELTASGLEHLRSAKVLPEVSDMLEYLALKATARTM